MSTDTEQEVRYAGFTKPQTVGILGMPLSASLAILGDLLIVTQVAPLVPGWVQLLLWTQLVLLLGACLIRNTDGVTVWSRLSSRARFNLYSITGISEYNPSFLGKKPPVNVMSAVKPLEYKDALGQTFLLLYYPTSQQYAVILKCKPTGGERLDIRDRNQRTTNWGGFSAALSRIRGAAQCSVVVESAPRSQLETLQRMEDYISDDGPEEAQAVTRERMNIGTENHVGNTTHVAVTFNAVVKGNNQKAHQANAEHIAGELPGIIQRLSASGAGRVTAVREAEAAEYMRAMVDPQARPLIEEAHAEGTAPGITWETCGPMHFDPFHDYLMHDQAVSATMVLIEPPGEAVPDTILADLMAPDPNIEIKRVALIKQVLNTGLARTLTRRDLNNAQNRKKMYPNSDPAQREIQLAARTMDETMAGHALEDFTIVVTVTVTDPANLKRAIQTVIGQLGNSAGCRFRIATEKQDVAFFYAGPFGLDLHQHSAPEVAQRSVSVNQY